MSSDSDYDGTASEISLHHKALLSRDDGPAQQLALRREKIRAEEAERKKHWDAIREATTYHRSMYYFPTVDPKLDKVPQSVGQYFKSPVSPPGDLACLPSDVLEDIVSLLDIQSFSRFRQVSRFARALATDIPLYKRVLAHGMEGLSALQRTELSCHFSLTDLHNVLTTSRCWICGKHGSFLFLPLCQRVCFDCLREDPETLVVNESKIGKRKMWKWIYEEYPVEMAEALARLRSMRIHDWKDQRKMSKGTRGVLAFDLRAAYNDVVIDMDDSADKLLYSGWLHYRLAAATPFPFVDFQTGETQRGVSCRGCQTYCMRDKNRFNFSAKRGDWFSWSCRVRDRSYSEKDFEEHFEQCVEAQEIWQDTQDGWREMKESDFFKMGGRYFSKASTRRREMEV